MNDSDPQLLNGPETPREGSDLRAACASVGQAGVRAGSSGPLSSYPGAS